MKKSNRTIGAFILASAIIWGITILSCSLKLKGTDCFSEIATILSLGAGLHLIMIWGPVAARCKKLTKDQPD